MFPKIDITSYLRQAREGIADDRPSTNGEHVPPKHEPTYSALLGSGWGNPKLLKPGPQPDKKEG